MYEVEVVIAVAFLFIVNYIINSFRNRKLAIQYSKMIKAYMSSHCERVGFRVYSRSSFRSLCQVKDSPRASYSRIEVAVLLTDRENLIHYPLSLITKEHDRLICWGYLKKATPIRLELFPTYQKRLQKKFLSDPSIREVSPHIPIVEDFLVFASDADLANRFLSNARIQKNLLKTRESIKRLSIDQEKSLVHLIYDLKRESLEPALDFLMTCGETLASIN